jgi:hypothetical protein
MKLSMIGSSARTKLTTVKRCPCRRCRSCRPGAWAGVTGVMTDIDDTLTRDGAIEPAALQALQALRAPACR